LRIILQLKIVGIGERIGINKNKNKKQKEMEMEKAQAKVKAKGKAKAKKFLNLIITISCYKTCIKSMHIPTHK
jgi:hypothetical protein